MIVGEKMVSAVIVAAGKGSRMQLSYNKMFIKLEEKAILLHTIEKFQGLVDEIIVVCHKDEMNDVKKLVSNDIVLVSGGDTRMESVYNGLQKARYNDVLVHDGARCNIKQEDINKVINGIKTSEACVLATKVKDTIKIYENGFLKTLPRDNLIAVQTPQAVKKNLFIPLIKKAILDKLNAFDEMQIIEKYSNLKIEVILGSDTNIKVTTLEDLEYLSFLRRK